MTFPVTYRRKIRFSDTDAQGIVFNANYLRYWDDTITDYFDELGIPWQTFVERGFDMVVAHAEIDFRSAARVGDELTTGARVAHYGTTSLRFELRTWNEASGKTVVEGHQIQVMVDRDTMVPVAVPDFFKQAVARFQDGIPPATPSPATG